MSQVNLKGVASTIDESVYMSTNIRATTPGTSISYTGGVWNTVRRDGTVTPARGFKALSTTLGGNVVVHCVEDPANNNTTYEIPSGGYGGFPMGIMFDKIIDSGTTIAEADLTILF